MATVTVKINPNTQVVAYEIEGVEGIKCTDITEALTAANEHIDTQYTSEYCIPEELPDYIESTEGDE